MRVAHLFEGIGGFHIASDRAGMETLWVSEVDKHASRVLDHHWPHVKNLGDVHGIEDAPAVDVLTGGFPCQDYSVAGTRGGLAGDRGALWWEYHRLIAGLRPTWVVGENVPGLLSSRGGRDFETIVGSLTECGYGVAWAVLDAQYFGVAQRRRRVFIVGHSGGVPRPEVLALGEGVFGHPEPSRTEGQDVAGTLAPGSQSGGQRSTDLDGHGAWVLQPNDRIDGRGALRAVPTDIAPTLSATEGERTTDRGVRIITSGATRQYQDVTESVAFAQNQRDEVRDLDDLAGSLAAEPGMKQQTYVLQEVGARESKNQNGVGIGLTDQDISYTLQAGQQHGIAQPPYTVRRLTPLECERLQGFPPVMILDMSTTRDELAATALAAGHLIVNPDTGRIYRTRGPGGMILSEPKEWGTSTVSGYLVGTLRVGDVRRQVRVHRVVWIAANGVPPEGMAVCHRNNEKTDNRLVNLYLASPERNSSDAREDGLYEGVNDNRRKLSDDDYELILRDYAEGDVTMRDLATKYGVSKSRIHQIIRLDGWTDIPGNSDTQRYRQLGNAVAVPVVEWLLRRIVEAD